MIPISTIASSLALMIDRQALEEALDAITALAATDSEVVRVFDYLNTVFSELESISSYVITFGIAVDITRIALALRHDWRIAHSSEATNETDEVWLYSMGFRYEWISGSSQYPQRSVA